MSEYTALLAKMSEQDREIVQAKMAQVQLTAARDTKNRMYVVAEMRAGPMRLEAVDFEGKVTFTMCYDNDVMAHMGEEAARLFSTFVTDTMERRPKEG